MCCPCILWRDNKDGITGIIKVVNVQGEIAGQKLRCFSINILLLLFWRLHTPDSASRDDAGACKFRDQYLQPVHSCRDFMPKK